MNLPQLASRAFRAISQNQTTLLTVGTIAGVVGTALVTAKVAPKAKEILDEKRKDLQETPKEDKETRRIIFTEGTKKLVPLVLPVVLSVGCTIACVIGLNKAHATRYAAATAAYTIAQTQLQEWKTKTEEVLGKSKVDKVRNAILEEDAKRDDYTLINKPKDPGEGKKLTLIRDPQTGVEFYSTIENVDAAVNRCQRDLNNGIDWITINDIYREIDSDIIPVGFGDMFGYNMGDLIDLCGEDSGYGAASNGDPCRILKYTPHLRKNIYGELASDYC